MREYSTLKPSLVRRRDVARCGVIASLLYVQGRLMCDNYGRLLASPEQLETDVLTALSFERQVTTAEIEAACGALVRAGIWHRYTVHGVQYIEDLTFDGDQNASWLQRRGAPEYPDPPDRPDLAYANREHYVGQTKTARVSPLRPADPQAPTTPPGGAVPPAGAPPEVPPQAGTQGAAPAQAGSTPLRQRAEFREFEQACRDGHMDGWLTDTAVDQFYQATVGCGREFGIIVEVAREAALSARDRSPSVRYGLGIIRDLPAEVKTRAEAHEWFDARGRTSRMGANQQGARSGTSKGFAAMAEIVTGGGVQ